jgi:hypothetical protein
MTMCVLDEGERRRGRRGVGGKEQQERCGREGAAGEV